MTNFHYGQMELDYLRKKDKKLGEAIDRIGFIEREVIPDLFTALVNSIVAQQISIKAVDTIWGRMEERFGEITAPNIAKQAVEDVQQCGMTMKKAVWIKSIAESVCTGDLDLNELAQLPDEEVCRRLCLLDGIGLWTAEMLMTFSLQRKDVVSWGDLAIRRGMMRLYHHKKLDKAKFERYKKRYSPYGTIASLYLWRISVE
ncbi:DNA-3-methyladenine glycosylase 2 family protein [Anaerospora sp.]|uniref:DNA-3-methyladenine glycosylase family protein n=1 Tax=Anaerospora sp. TaxID=1960278 RepID=UPI00289FD613|nr:DNA-3-methyladenine glycosylase 2 family protein [Anaerospora sp.]